MQKRLLFGNSEGYLLGFEDKNKIIDYLYSKIELSNHRYSMLKDVNTLKFLQDNEHYVSANFKGNNYLIIMTTIDNKKYCVAIDRKKLSYHKNQLDMKTLQVIQFNIKSTDDIFRGTIFDGKMIQSNNQYVFLILDCFYLMGQNKLKIDINEKLNHLDSIFKNNFIRDINKKYCNNFELKLNKLSKYNELESLVESISTKLKPLNPNGLIFFPKYSGMTIIFLENNNASINVVDKSTNKNEIIESSSYNIIHEFTNFLKSRTYAYEKSNEKQHYKIFWLSKTVIPDVYNISEKVDSEKMGIALIPNLKISHMCSDLIGDNPVKFNCVYSNKFKKWVPLSVV